jgi:glycosyltransferase involved in cell wall biosynthesis
MRILQIHNKYRPGWGGEDTVANLESDLLRRKGHEVERLSAWTGELEGASPLRIMRAGLDTIWSFRAYGQVTDAIRRFSPDVIHVHNFFPMFSPSVYWAANRAGIPVVQTLHNYRLTCANSLLLRADKPCEACVGRFPWSALRYRCHSSAFSRTLAVTLMNVLHRWAGTFRTKVQGYIALTEFSKDIMVRAGLPRDRIYVKPNFSEDPGRLASPRLPRFLFAGSIQRFKGIHLLLEAWRRHTHAEYQLLVVGDGPDRAELAGLPTTDTSVVWLGMQPREKVIELIAGSRWLVLPSLAYENFPMSVLEAFSVGTPVIVPNHGAFTKMVSDREGLFFAPGNVESLTITLQQAHNMSETAWLQSSSNARDKYLLDYAEQTNYSQLIYIYRQAIESFDATRNHVHRQGTAKIGSAVAGLQKPKS